MGDQIFYSIHDPNFHYRCRIPELLGRRIHGCFYGWVILSDDPHNVVWSLWNPVTSKIIQLPPLNLKDGNSESIGECCLSSPPNDPSSILLLTITDKLTFLFCRLDDERKGLGWTEMSYSEQLKRITGDGNLLSNLTCCDGKVYALNDDNFLIPYIIHVDIEVKDTEVLLDLSLFAPCPFPPYNQCPREICFLKGYGRELFYIMVGFKEKTKKTIGFVSLFKLDMTSIKWEKLEFLKDRDITGFVGKSFEELETSNEIFEDKKMLDMICEMWEEVLDLKNSVFFVDLARDHSVFYSPSIVSKLGGYIHLRSEMGRIIYSYNLKDKTISISSMFSLVLPTSHVSGWECRLEDDHGEVKCTDDYKQEEDAIVVTPETPLTELQTYSSISPWLMVLDKDRRVVTLTHPMFGDKHVMKHLPVWVFDDIRCFSKYGWLLFYSYLGLVFYNPFTDDMRQLPDPQPFYRFGSMCFSAPPTSTDCMVVGFISRDVYIHFVAGDPSWRKLNVDVIAHDSYHLRFPTLYGKDLYGLHEGGDQLHVFKGFGEKDDSREEIVAEIPRRGSRAQAYLMKCDQHLLVVIVGEIGEFVEVFKLDDSTKKWGKIDGLGRYMIYICDTTCLCIEAKSSKMENKIYFPQFHSGNGKIVFYSLETRMYHTFNAENIEEAFGDLTGTYHHHVKPHAWIEPSWS